MGTSSCIARSVATLAGNAAILAVSLAIGGCSAGAVSKVGALDPRLAWPCDRLLVEWAVKAPRLEAAIAEEFSIREFDGAGRLQLHVMQCKPEPSASENSQELAYAYVLVPISGDSAPIALTRIPSDGWFALQQAAANEPMLSLLGEFGYPVVESAQSFTIAETNGEESIAIELQFGSGRVLVEASATGDSSIQTADVAYFSRADGLASVYFGQEVSERHKAWASVRLEGQTLLSGFDLTAPPQRAILDRRLIADRIFWRVPAG